MARVKGKDHRPAVKNCNICIMYTQCFYNSFAGVPKECDKDDFGKEDREIVTPYKAHKLSEVLGDITVSKEVLGAMTLLEVYRALERHKSKIQLGSNEFETTGFISSSGSEYTITTSKDRKSTTVKVIIKECNDLITDITS
jgi:hypothetical protein